MQLRPLAPIFAVLLAVFHAAAFTPLSAASAPADTPPEAPGPRFPVTGSVTDTDGAPVEGARVYLAAYLSDYEVASRVFERRGVERTFDRTTTDAGGRYRLRAPAGGLFRVIVAADNFRPIQRRTGAVTAPVQLPPAPLPAATTAGVVLFDDDGAPIADAAVAAWPDPNRSSASDWLPYNPPTRSDESGQAHLRAGADEYPTLTVARADGAPMWLTLGKSSAELETAPGQPMAVRAVDREGRPVPGALFFLGQLPLARADGDGRATLFVSYSGVDAEVSDGVLSGSVSLRLPTPTDGGAPRAEPREPAETVVVLEPPRTVSGRVIDARRRVPVAEALVWSWADPSAAVRTDGLGRFELPLPDRPVEAAAAGYKANSAEVDAEVGALADLVLEPAAAVSGVVTAGGSPVADAQVGVLPVGPDGGIPPTTATDGQGRFHLSTLDVDTAYELHASAPGFATALKSLAPLGVGEVSPPVNVTLMAPLRAFGHVIDADEHPLAGASVDLLVGGDPEALRRVLVRTGFSPPPLAATTDAAGRFEIDGIDPGTYRLRARSPGLAPTRVPGLALDHPDDGPQGPIDLGTIVVVAGAAVDGLVTDPGGRPLPDVSITTVPAMRSVTAFLETRLDDAAPVLSDESGRFRLDSLIPGETLTLALRKEGWIGETTSVTAPDADRPPSEISLVMRRAVTLVVQVHDEDRRPVPNANVALYFPAGGSAGVHFTDASGRASLGPLAAGTYSLSVAAEGYLPDLRTGLEISGHSPLDIELRRGVEIRGVVLSPDDTPVAGATVSSPGAGRAQATTDGDGAFRLGGLEPGRRLVIAQHPKWGVVRAGVEVARSDDGGNPVVELRFPAGVTVQGVVLDESEGTPVAGAAVQLDVGTGAPNLAGRPVTPVTADGDGRFTFPNVPPGVYTPSASHADYARTAGEPFEASRTPVRGLRLELGRGEAIAGRLLGVDLSALSRVQVRLLSDRFESRTASPDFEGLFLVDRVSAGTWTIRADVDGRTRSETLSVEDGDGVVEVEIDLEAGADVDGTVSRGGAPAGGLWVIATHRDERAEFSARSGPDGRFTLRGLEAGDYRVDIRNARGDGLHHALVPVDGPWDFELRTGVVAGHVLDPDGVGLAAELFLSVNYGPGVTRGGRRYVADRSGRFALGELADGGYRLTAKAIGFAELRRPFDVVDGEELDLEIVLTPSEGLRLRPVRADGGRPSQLTVATVPPSGQGFTVTSVAVDADGLLHLPFLAPGTQTLVVREEGGPSLELTVGVAGSGRQPIDVRLPRGGRLTVDATALFDAGHAVDAQVLRDDGTPHRSIGGFYGHLRQDLLRGPAGPTPWPLVAGEYEVLVTADDGREWLIPVAVVDGADVRVTVP
ncbi:MAG: carboxypeptidase-like regulatory domain-containing protein [Acidobacteriota bacterium]